MIPQNHTQPSNAWQVTRVHRFIDVVILNDKICYFAMKDGHCTSETFGEHMSNRQNYCNTDFIFGSPLLSEVCTKSSQPIGDDPIRISLCWMSHFIVFGFQLIFRNLHPKLRIPYRYPTDTLN